MAHELQIVKVRSAYYAPDYELTPRELYWNSGNGFRYSNCFSWNDEDFHNGVDSSNTEYDDYYIGNGSPEKAASSSSKRADFFSVSALFSSCPYVFLLKMIVAGWLGFYL